jgi:hypothetical protein
MMSLLNWRCGETESAVIAKGCLEIRAKSCRNITNGYARGEMSVDPCVAECRGMTFRRSVSVLGLLLVIWNGSLLSAFAQQRPTTDKLFPFETMSYVAVPDPEEFRSRWERTELGRLLQDPAMKPFRDDLRQQIDRDLLQAEVRIGVTWQDIEGIAGGEMAMGMVMPPRENASAAVLSLVDVSGKDQHVERLSALIAQNFQQRGGLRTEKKLDAHTIVHWDFPATRQRPVARQAYFCLHDHWFVATDDVDVLGNVLARINDHANNALVELPAYQSVMRRCSEESGSEQPHLKWFIEPFGYAEGIRAATGPRERSRDRIQILKNQGFESVQGLGGLVFLAVGTNDVVHRSFIHAPREKRVLAARMLDFPATQARGLPAWATQQFASLLTFNWEMAKAFDASETLVNALAGNDIFQPALDDIKVDPNGLEVDIRAEIIRYLGRNVILATEITQPIDVQSEKHLAAFELADAARVEATLNRALPKDPSVIRRVFGRHVVWEIIRKENLDDDAGRGGFKPIRRTPGELPILGSDGRRGGTGTPLFKNAALTVAFGHLIYGSDVDYLGRFVTMNAQHPPLASQSDYQAVQEALKELGANENENVSFQHFVRNDVANEPNYEMFRQGKMSKNESLLAYALNWLLAPDDEGIEREQRYDGSKLPEYSEIRGYFRPAGLFVTTEQNGWLVSGCLLGREARQAALP